MKRLYRAFKHWLYLPDGAGNEIFNLLLFGILAVSSIVAIVSFTRTLGIFLALFR
ncbi:hypothetical protein [uncultured Lactobacillus sp.]|uniref:hypothetical protein n=1 Tax=uncultured Lactobacillus sp. TaxID=153152 RepID=UPI00259B54E7|nr:hypothetical protein [uncultured Lactobacillus sp.]